MFGKIQVRSSSLIGRSLKKRESPPKVEGEPPATNSNFDNAQPKELAEQNGLGFKKGRDVIQECSCLLRETKVRRLFFPPVGAEAGILWHSERIGWKSGELWGNAGSIVFGSKAELVPQS